MNDNGGYVIGKHVPLPLDPDLRVIESKGETEVAILSHLFRRIELICAALRDARIIPCAVTDFAAEMDEWPNRYPSIVRPQDVELARKMIEDAEGKGYQVVTVTATGVGRIQPIVRTAEKTNANAG